MILFLLSRSRTSILMKRGEGPTERIRTMRRVVPPWYFLLVQVALTCGGSWTNIALYRRSFAAGTRHAYMKSALAVAVVLFAWTFLSRSAYSQDRRGPADTLFGPASKGNAIPPLYRRSLNVLIQADDLYQDHKYQDALKLLNRLWDEVPPGSARWIEAGQQAQAALSQSGFNIGTPPGYYALQMLTECCRWKQQHPQPVESPTEIVWTILLVGHLEGRQPRTAAERAIGTGPMVRLDLDPRLAARNHQVIRQSTRLFCDYVSAITQGQLQVRLNVVPLNDVTATGRVTPLPQAQAGLDGTGYNRVWAAVPQELVQRTDWWWLIYPSIVPEQHPDFRTTEFITGGMGGGPNNGSPLFIIDDKWLLRKPPHLGHGEMHALERRAYLPQWLQHEFFHHLFRIYPEFQLESARGHDWFDRSTWPADFEGNFEPDYYAEALHKRLQRSERRLVETLKVSSTDLSQSITAAQLAGRYERTPIENDWHRGTLSVLPQTEEPKLEWQNAAGVRWPLTLELKHGQLLCGPESPYFASPQGKSFQIKVAKGRSKTIEVIGFHFNGEYYRRTKVE
jgi:hypothetical protein